MNALLQRLRELRAEVGHAAPPPPPGLAEDLRRLQQVRRQLSAVPGCPYSRDREVPGIEVAPGLRFTETWSQWPIMPTVIDARFARVDGAVPGAKLLHFDTETTGLAGGTGTKAFMVGAADWVDGRFRLRQLTLTTLGAEAAMLRTFASWLDRDTVLVSYNGKCYDAPLLATRYRMARLDNPLAGLRHIDLVHPARRRWKGVWDNCRLATIERQVLGVVREDDLPGAEAPQAWLTYLRGGSAATLRRVADHNAQDLRSLASLLLHMATLEAWVS